MPEFVTTGSEGDSQRYYSFLSNDYLGLSRHPEIVSRAQSELQSVGLSMCSSRVVGGTSSIHQKLEAALAKSYVVESALLFSSGYMANLGVITTLVSRRDVLILDRLCHASLYDAARLSGAKLLRFQHNCLGHLEELLSKLRSEDREQLISVVTESVFSMDGDVAPLESIAELCRRYAVRLVIDEAHAFPPSQESCQHGDDILRMVTLSKCYGSLGGAVLCSSEFRERLVNESRPFIFDTALSPLHAAGALAAIELMEGGAVDIAGVYRKAGLFREILRSAGFDTGQSVTQIVPLMVGNEKLAIEMRERLAERGILVGAIRSPTVPRGKARLRFGVCSGHSDSGLRFVAETVTNIGREIGLI